MNGSVVPGSDHRGCDVRVYFIISGIATTAIAIIHKFGNIFVFVRSFVPW